MEKIVINIDYLIESINMDSNGVIKEDIKQLVHDKIQACIDAVKK